LFLLNSTPRTPRRSGNPTQEANVGCTSSGYFSVLGKEEQIRRPGVYADIHHTWSFQMMELSGFLGFLILVLDIYAIYKTWSSDASNGAKLIWSIVIFFLPILGVLLWFLFGPKGDNHRSVTI